MLHLSNSIKRFAALNAALLLLLAILLPLAAPLTVNAAQLTERSLSLSSSAPGSVTTGTAGEGQNGQKTKHTISFKIATTEDIGSILIQYCDSPVVAVTCNTPTGFNANNLPDASATLSTTGFNAGAFTVDKTTSNPTGCNGGGTTRTNCVLLDRASAVSEDADDPVTISYGGSATDYITNPTTLNYSFYARITTYETTTYGTEVDTGSVAASTAQQITITARMPERLEFSVGVGTGGPPLAPPAPGTTCAAINDPGALTLGDANGVLSTATAYDAHSYFRVNSNTIWGTKIYYSGDTLKNGSNVITAMPTNGGLGTDSVPGTRQFGLGLDDSNTNWSFTDLTKTSGAYEFGDGDINSPFTTPAQFAFETSSLATPVEIAASTDTISCDTGAIRYIANVSTDTPAGIYTTIITYIATGTY